tara:strand:+ start:494 stop:886 length:393 start_codon:yes stop_codon:yes gene_type:complete
MSVFKKQTVVKSYPAFDVVRREKGNFKAINVTAGEIITDTKMLDGWRLGSVVSYALQYNECPIEAIEDAKSKGEALHWISGITVIMSSRPKKEAPRILIKEGEVINFEGKLFTVAPAANNNKTLIPYVAS